MRNGYINGFSALEIAEFAKVMSRARSNSTAGFFINSLKTNARRLSLAHLTNRADYNDLELQSESIELQRIRNQLQVTPEKQQTRERRRKDFAFQNNEESDNEYVPLEEMGAAAILFLIIFVIFILYVAEGEIMHLKYVQHVQNITIDMQN